MVKNIIAATIVIFLGSSNTLNAQKNTKTNLKFIDDIEVGFAATTDHTPLGKGPKPTYPEPETIAKKEIFNTGIENASSLQFKYSLLLNTEVEQITNLNLFALIDEWFGTRYRLGGETKKGIDCSAFVQVMYAGLFGIAVPRTAREQYNATRKISRTELQEGDLVFFNTRGGVSHVGIYLQNNKFVHAAASGGVMISDLYDEYWVKRFIGVGRHEAVPVTSLFSKP